MSEGFFKIWRSLYDSPTWKNSTPEHKAVLITILGMVNWSEKSWEWQGENFKCSPGQTVTSLSKIAEKCGKGVSLQNVRGALARLSRLNFLTDLPTKTGRLITVINWSTYQDSDRVTNIGTNNVTNKEVTKNQQRGNKEVTPKKKERKEEDKKKRKKENENLNDFENDKTFAIRRIIKNLSEKTGQKFNPNIHSTERAVCDLLHFYNEPEIMKVVNYKIEEWKDNVGMKKHLNPGTLFAPDKFEKYFNNANQEYKYKPPKPFVDNGLLQNDPIISDRFYREHPDLAEKHNYDLTGAPL